MAAVVPYSSDIDAYLACDSVIDHDDEAIKSLADSLYARSDSPLGFIQAAYEHVRDHIAHSADVNEDALPCTASEVLAQGHGICFAKSHLLAALLRSQSIPAGFCYQKIILDDETAPVLIYHGLNGVYLPDQGRWIRLDARGNKEGVDAQFSVDEERLAFPIRPEWNEADDPTVYPNPDKEILRKFHEHTTRTQLWDDLPTTLAYDITAR